MKRAVIYIRTANRNEANTCGNIVSFRLLQEAES